jgi:hypothetical protein
MSTSASSAFDVGGVAYFETLLRDARGEVRLLHSLHSPLRDAAQGCSSWDADTIANALQVRGRSTASHSIIVLAVGCLFWPRRRETRPHVPALLRFHFTIWRANVLTLAPAALAKSSLPPLTMRSNPRRCMTCRRKRHRRASYRCAAFARALRCSPLLAQALLASPFLPPSQLPTLINRIAALSRRSSNPPPPSAADPRAAAAADLTVSEILAVTHRVAQELCDNSRCGAAAAAVLPLLQWSGLLSSMRAHARAAAAALVLTLDEQLIEELCRCAARSTAASSTASISFWRQSRRSVGRCFVL